MIRLSSQNDTNTMNLDKKEEKIINLFLKKERLKSSDVHSLIGGDKEVSLVSVKRVLSKLADKGFLDIKGSGRSTSYEISTLGRIFADIDQDDYLSVELDKRYGLKRYNFELFSSFPLNLFTETEMNVLSDATVEYERKTKDVSDVINKKELERLIIEFSWKSSQIEGNTYSLLDTENLILREIEAEGKTKEETQMILNHKNAFKFVYENKDLFGSVTKENLKRVHKILVEGLNVSSEFRKSPVGISGSTYQPLDNVYQIEEAVEELSNLIEKIDCYYTKSLVSLLGISYIQVFDDGNKRTARVLADAILLSGGYAPLSYRSVDPKKYKEAKLIFYELNSIVPFKKIFITQYDFSARNYALK